MSRMLRAWIYRAAVEYEENDIATDRKFILGELT
jgi:hypothetical protein